jgi:hypothetical protein
VLNKTISESYRKQQEQLHRNPNYGMASVQFAPFVSRLVNQLQIEELLDIGAGKCRLFENLQADHKLRLQAYDPAIPELASEPVPMQMTTCIDVLEHVEPELLDDFLDFLAEKTLEIGFFTIHTGPAMKTLPDGRNAHLIQEGAEWWLPQIMRRFDLQMFQKMDQGFMVVMTAKD